MFRDLCEVLLARRTVNAPL